MHTITSASCNKCNTPANGSLIFNSIDQSHAGMYTCFIVNDPSTATNAYLTIAG